MKNQKLTTRQWETYNLIKSNTALGYATTIDGIIAHYDARFHNGGYERSTEQSHDPCKAVWNDITAINASSEVEKIIIIDNFTYRLATEEEANAYFDNLKKKALRAMVRAYNVKRKIDKDGQGKLISCQGEAIDDDSRARRFVEAFIEEAKENEQANG